ncbi:PREDICTED: G-type lectin S-receptor-like serine/threonine-protein kinase RKS1, partial [Populus euphratica]
LIQFSTSLDTISVNQSVKDGDVIVSSGEFFALGFFRPGKSNYRYLGIWYNKISEKNVVWVANRDSPINDSSGVLSITNEGKLVLHSQNQDNPLWFTNVTVSSKNQGNSTAQLLDSGNLVLLDSTGAMIWQSFDYPSHTMLPNLKLGLDRRTGLNRFLTAWKSPDDPGTGSWSFRLNPNGSPQLFLYEGQIPRWRSGHWNGLRWTGVPILQVRINFNISFVNNDDELSITWGVRNRSIFSRLVVDEPGSVQRFTWHEQIAKWDVFWSAPADQCDNYGRCGAYGKCDPYDAYNLECTCLPGYQPKSISEWYLRDGSGGCIQKNLTGMCNNGEGFVKVENVKVPDPSTARVDNNLDLKACMEQCLRNCSCTAYASSVVTSKSGCFSWYGNLLDTRVFAEGGQDLYVRVDAFELAQYDKKSRGFLAKKGMLAGLVLSIAAAVFFVIMFSFWLIKWKKMAKGRQLKFPFNIPTSLNVSLSEKEVGGSGTSQYLPVFDIDIILAATENFSYELGYGGFGSVYKGKLDNGQEIAVKRLSKTSGQGMKEFMNEVRLISKLQHRNLVKLFGCCIHEEEKMLIYEYLPNKSLDFFIFDETKRVLLDWRKRFEIVSGIARGVLYLHQDSRLKIIHRDLKASNILLDAAMNPKISDFGMARMFMEDQVHGKTTRVVGTYGYMSPEYAIHGQYSIKSDVFSYGVLTLEIISGRKNSDYGEKEPWLNLIGHVWDLWREEKALDMVDPMLEQSCPPHEVLRCIQIGLLCVQEFPDDRPTMLEVVFMLGNEITLPSPKKPAFVLRTRSGQDFPAMSRRAVCSVNEVTVTMVAAR